MFTKARQHLTLFILFVLVLVVGAASNSVHAKASPIDIVRASNAYTTAKTHYLAGRYSDAKSSLKIARTNLKGPTNQDLEYLDIMTQYKLKKYSESYKQLLQYFETPPWKDNYQSFRNIETLADDNIDYDAKLTEVFDKLEKWASIQQSADPVNDANRIGKAFAKSVHDRIVRERNNLDVSNLYESNRSAMGGGPNTHFISISEFTGYKFELGLCSYGGKVSARLYATFNAKHTYKDSNYAGTRYKVKSQNKEDSGGIDWLEANISVNDSGVKIYLAKDSDMQSEIKSFYSIGELNEPLYEYISDHTGFSISYNFSHAEQIAFESNKDVFKNTINNVLKSSFQGCYTYF